MQQSTTQTLKNRYMTAIMMLFHLSLVLNHAGFFQIDAIHKTHTQNTIQMEKKLHDAAPDTHNHSHKHSKHDDLQEKELERQRYRKRMRKQK